MIFFEPSAGLNSRNPVILYHTKTKNRLGGLHWHEHIEMLFCIDGEGIVAVDTHTVDFKKGMLVVANPGHLHYVISKGYLEYYCFKVSKEFLSESGLVPGKFEFCECIEDENLYGYFETVEKEYLEKCEVSLRAATLTLIAYLYKNYQRPVQEDTYVNENIKIGIKYIREHYKEKITLDEVAAAAGFSKFYFSKLFKEHTKITVFDYLRQLRCEEARKLLETTNLSISDIALECGFEDIAYFSNVFKNECGLSPSQTRKNL